MVTGAGLNTIHLNEIGQLRSTGLDAGFINALDIFFQKFSGRIPFTEKLNFSIMYTAESPFGETPAFVEIWDRYRSILTCRVTLNLELFQDLDRLYVFVHRNRLGTLRKIVELTGISIDEFHRSPLLLALFILLHEIGHINHFFQYLAGNPEMQALADINLTDAIGMYQWKEYDEPLKEIVTGSINIADELNTIRTQYIAEHGSIQTPEQEDEFTKYLETVGFFDKEKAFKDLPVESGADQFAVECLSLIRQEMSV